MSTEARSAFETSDKKSYKFQRAKLCLGINIQKLGRFFCPYLFAIVNFAKNELPILIFHVRYDMIKA